MRAHSDRYRFLRIALVLLPLAGALAACETLENLNPLEEKKTPLTGDRRAVFPQGVPGVEFNAPPTQPSNSNVQIPPQAPAENNPDAQNQPNPNAPANSEDPWAGRRR